MPEQFAFSSEFRRNMFQGMIDQGVERTVASEVTDLAILATEQAINRTMEIVGRGRNDRSCMMAWEVALQLASHKFNGLYEETVEFMQGQGSTQPRQGAPSNC
jgi:hypothetical protein